jgi:uncharacterized protein (UPF0332 family)
MLSAEGKRQAKGHLSLAQGFMSTAQVGDGSSEYEIRNAFSRVYYAFFHACCAFLLGQGNDPVWVEQLAKDHGRLRSNIRHPMGKGFEHHVKEAYDRRRQSDYKPDWLVPSSTLAQEELKRARTYFHWILRTTQRTLV